MPVARVNDVELAYDAVGDGPPLMLIHGSWSERTTWLFVVPALAESFRVVSYDRRGHGESGGRPDEGTVHDDVADAAGLIEALDVAPAHILANSYGACIALRLACEHPELVGRVCGHEPPLHSALEADAATRPIAAEQRQLLGEVREYLERGEDARGAQYFVEQVALGPGMWAQLPPPVQETFVRNAATFLGELRDPEALRADLDALAGIAAPVLITDGDQSAPMFDPIAAVLAATLPDARRETMSGAGHVPQLTHPEEYAAIARDFLGRSPGAT